MLFNMLPLKLIYQKNRRDTHFVIFHFKKRDFYGFDLYTFHNIHRFYTSSHKRTNNPVTRTHDTINSHRHTPQKILYTRKYDIKHKKLTHTPTLTLQCISHCTYVICAVQCADRLTDSPHAFPQKCSQHIYAPHYLCRCCGCR